MRNTKRKAPTVLALLLAAWFGAFALPLWAEVQLQLDRTRITEGETVTLTFRTDDARQNLEADFGPLEEDFQILDRRTETQLSIVNGRQAAVVRMLVTVEPRRTGDITIPPLDFGGSRTQPVVLRVDPAPEPEPGALPPVFLEVEISPREGPYYVHAQLGLVVRVFYLQNLTEAAISPPEPSPASVRLLQETPYQAERGGERYSVLERRYAIFPERSGEMTLPAMQLSGRLVERRNSSIWQPSTRGRRVAVASDPVTLNIEPRPVAFTGGEWQPARAYNISQQVSGTDGLRVGEPVTRTVIIDAVGLEENMIAEPPWPEMPDVRIYPDQPQGISRDDGEWVLGHKEFRYAVVPEREGEMVLPELTVHWWDTENDRQRTATLPAQTVYVKPSALVPPPADAAPAFAPSPGAGLPPGPAEPSYWRWVALLFGGLWLLTLTVAAVLIRTRASGRPQRGASHGRPAGESADLTELKSACREGDARRARRALRSWLRRYGPSADGSLLEFAAAQAGSELARLLRELDATDYRPGDDSSWDGQATWSAFERWLGQWRASRAGRRPSPTDLYAPANRRR